MGEIELDGKVLIVRRIHTTYHLAGVAPDDRETAERVLGFHAEKCPVARSIEKAIDISTELQYVD